MVSRLHDILRKLETYQNTDYPILSAYFTLPDKQKDSYHSLHSQLHESVNLLSANNRAEFVHELEYIEGLFSEKKNFNHNSRGLAIFAGGNKLWEVVSTPFELKPVVIVQHSPFLEPIYFNLETYKRYLVVLADREKARFFTIQGGRVETEGSVIDPSVPQEVRANEQNYYGRSDKISRHIQDHLHRHFKLIAQKVNNFVKGKPISGVIVGGHDTLIHKTEQYLPKQLQKKVVAEFISELNTNLTQIASQSMEIIEALKTRNFRVA